MPSSSLEAVGWTPRPFAAFRRGKDSMNLNLIPPRLLIRVLLNRHEMEGAGTVTGGFRKINKVAWNTVLKKNVGRDSIFKAGTPF